MSTRDALIQELMKQPEKVLRDVRRYLESLTGHESKGGNGASTGWPERYFERTAGAFADEPFERPPQLPFEKREEW
ncbi:MAG: hypothetical protein EPO07_05550 [Verrucomicrobia bacterium]|nr:MAG: hypothetical protein EPO07_05550 [Verrucomicrobiota bacterium]